MTESDSSTSENRLDVLAEDFVVRYRRGERPGLSEYVEGNPELADEIRDLFPALVMMEDARPAVPRRIDAFSDFNGTANGKKIERLGDYRILCEVGRGGMGIVYEAEQESLGRHVALKVLPRHSLLDPRYLQRFEREARAAARLHHTNIVPVFGIGEQDGLHYYVMQFIQGQGLDTVLFELKRLRAAASSENAAIGSRVTSATNQDQPRGSVEGVLTTEPLKLPSRQVGSDLIRSPDRPEAQPERSSAFPAPPAFDVSSSNVQLPGQEQQASLSGTGRMYWHGVARVGIQVADALAYAHSQGVLHRDIKPSNLLLDTHGTVWVTDFGLAKSTDSEDLTHSGDIVGTLRYLAPERLQGRSDHRSDIYSLGVTLYELLTLQPPFDENDRTALVRQIMHSEPVRLRSRNVEIPRDLETIVLKAMAKEAVDRYATPTAFAEDLRRFLADRAIIARRPALWERTWRLCRRNRTTAGLVGALLLALLVGLVGVTWKWREAVEAREAEGLARRDADELARENRQGLLDLQTAHTLLDEGRLLTEIGRWDDADRSYSEAIRIRPDYGHAWDARGLLYARLGLFDLAAFDLNKAFELQKPVFGWRWFALALLRRQMGDTDGYQRVCNSMRLRFEGSKGPTEAMLLLRTWILAPQRDVDVAPLLESAESVLISYPNAWSHYVVGTAHYRLGHYEQAEKRLQTSQVVDPAGWNARAIAFPVLALTYWKRGNLDEAHRALREAGQAIDQWTTQLYGSQEAWRWPIHQGAEGAWPIDTWDWLECQQNYRDAKILIDGVPPAVDPRLLVWRARAFAALRRRDTADTEYRAVLKLLPADPLIQIEAHRNRGYVHANEGRWEDASVEFGRARDLAPSEAQLWSFHANAKLASGNVDAYRSACEAMLKQFHMTDDPRTAHLVLFACATRPDALCDMSALIPLARLAAPWHHGNVRVLGAALYRAGDYTGAVERLEESARVYHPRTWERCFLAMAYYRSGRTQQARQCLAQAQDWMREAIRGGTDDVSGIQRFFDTWEESVQFPILLREANSLIADNHDEQLQFDAPHF